MVIYVCGLRRVCSLHLARKYQISHRSFHVVLFFFVSPKTGAKGAVLSTSLEAYVRYFRNPCDRDPPTGNFKNFKFFKNSLKILNVYFGE